MVFSNSLTESFVLASICASDCVKDSNVPKVLEEILPKLLA